MVEMNSIFCTCAMAKTHVFFFCWGDCVRFLSFWMVNHLKSPCLIAKSLIDSCQIPIGLNHGDAAKCHRLGL